MTLLTVYVTDELPEGFTQQMQEESQRSRPKYQPPVQQTAASPKAPENSHKENNKVCLHSFRSVCRYVDVHFLVTSKCVVCQVTEKDEAASMKDWILRYAEQSSDEEEEEEEGEKPARNPELEEKFDPVS